MDKQINIFNVRTMDEEIEKEFYDFFPKWNLMRLFADENKTGQIVVSDADIRATINPHGAYHQDFKELSDHLAMADDNNKYQLAVFKMIEGAKSLKKVVNNIREVNKLIKHDIRNEHLFNTWNIVFYDDDVS